MPKGQPHVAQFISTPWRWMIFATIMLFLVGCNATKHVPQDRYLLTKNVVKVEGTAPKTSKEEIEEIIKQHPNRKFLFAFHLFTGAHNYSLKKPKKKIRKWVKKSIAEEPVVIDTFLVRKSAAQIKEYFFQHGYFNAEVTTEIQDSLPFREAQRKAKVIYSIVPKEPYYIDNYRYFTQNKHIQYLIDNASNSKQIKPGELYQYELLEAERKRVVNLLQNNGFYDFTREYVQFDIDSTNGDHTVNVLMRIRPPAGNNGEHTRKYISNIQVFSDYNFFEQNPYYDTVSTGDLKILYQNKLKINPKLINQRIFFNKELYSSAKVEKTYRAFSSLGLYNNISINFEKTGLSDDSLRCRILLTPGKRNSFTLEPRLETRAVANNQNAEQSTTTFNFGISGNLSYQRNNAFKSGEMLRFSLSAGLEPFFLNDSSTTNFFNTTEFGPTVSLYFPRFLLPISQDRIPQSTDAKTVLSLSYSILSNSDLKRRSSKVTFGYDWNETPEKRHIVNPVEFSLVNADISDRLTDRINSIGDPLLVNTYRDQIISASSYSFIYNNQTTVGKSRDMYYFRAKVEGAGNVLRLLGEKNEGLFENTDNGYQIGGITFAQYGLLESEFRTYQRNFLGNTIAYRLFAGIAKPLTNLQTLPFEKSYFAGGANGNRAWLTRTLGPGNYLDTNNFGGFLNRIGEIKLETNLEFRFNIIGFIEGALFTDIGNIWVIDERSGRSETEFGAKFYEQIAIGGGAGLRLDFDFFIFRFDAGFKLRDPALPGGEKWIFQPKDEYNNIVNRYNQRNELSGLSAINYYRYRPSFQLGIGYPF